MELNQAIKNIEYLGDKYCEKHLSDWNKNPSVLQNNWWEGLKYLFKHSFMRGRNDKLSNAFCEFTITVIKENYNINDSNSGETNYSHLDEAYEKLVSQRHYFDKKIILASKQKAGLGKNSFLKNKNLTEEIIEKNPFIKMLVTPRNISFEWNNQTHKTETKLTNDDDTMMVLDTLKFITSSPENKNIYKVIKDKLENQQLKEAYELLTGPSNVDISKKNFNAIGDKIASFIIRDILLLNPGIKVKDEDLKMVFPVDTWVRKIARKLKFQAKTDREIKEKFINLCKENGINIPKCAAGLWYLGFHSLDILIENCLDKIDLRNLP